MAIMKNQSGIYTITSPDGAKFAAMANNIYIAMDTAKKQLNRGIHASPSLNQAAALNGMEALVFAPYFLCYNKEDLRMYKKQIVDDLKPSHNSPVGGKKGRTFSASTCQKMSVDRKGKKRSAPMTHSARENHAVAMRQIWAERRHGV